MTLIGLAAAMVLAGHAATAPKPLGDAALWVTPSDYPGLEHEPPSEWIGARLDVDADGRVAGCSIVESSGSSSLDGITCRRLQQRARFDPARDARGTPVPGRWSIRVRWALPD